MSNITLPSLPELPDNEVIPLSAIRYVPGYTKSFVQEYATAYARAALAAQPGAVGESDYDALEREHMGDFEKKTGIYAAPTEAKPAQDAVDAERYRWLRENNAYSIHDRLFADCPMHKFNDTMLDVAIDAAISAKKGQP